MKILKALCAFILFILITPVTKGQSFQQIDSIINGEITKHTIAGGNAVIIHNRKTVFSRSYGEADISSHTAMRQDAIFRIASMTKAIVSVAVLQLAAQHKIGLDDPIEKYIPAFASQQVAVISGDSFLTVNRNRSVTIRDLLSHQSGISSADEFPAFRKLFNQYGLDQSLNMGFANLEEEVNRIAAMPLVHQPGARFSYGLSTNVLGRLIEIVSGLTLKDYLTKNIFRPLKMKDTYFYLPENKRSRLVKVYVSSKAAGDTEMKLTELDPVQYPVNYPLQKDHGYYSAIGGLVSTTGDYAKFLLSLLHGGRKAILSKDFRDSLTTNQLGNKTFIFGGVKSLNTFGLGVGLTSKPGMVINNASEGSFFWAGAFNTAYMVDPKRDLITLFYFQKAPFVFGPVLSKLEKTAIGIIDGMK